MNNEPMANDEIKKGLQDILNLSGKVTRKRLAKGIKERELFCTFIENFKYSNDRTLLLKAEHRIDFVDFEEPFVQAIEALLKLNYNKDQVAIIEWWLYEKWNQHDGSVLQLNNTETGEELPTDKPEELWDLIQSLK